ncbi:hypothetical protein NPIL_33501 [Nephila pilipes]|uniref:Uncharacterized protein n=1 Tax=Nephila pilipes TaxID=299642 RepID=A0A8X6QH71_NEPPI|nr:hypothetical protein NPIL_33501 [Nephila pilipes]
MINIAGRQHYFSDIAYVTSSELDNVAASLRRSGSRMSFLDKSLIAAEERSYFLNSLTDAGAEKEFKRPYRCLFVKRIE